MFSEQYNISIVPPYIVLLVSLAFISTLDSSHTGLWHAVMEINAVPPKWLI